MTPAERLAAITADRDAQRARADRYLELIHTAVSHHVEQHPGCTYLKDKR